MNCIVNLLVLLGFKTFLRIFPFNYKICKAFKATNHSSHFLKPKPRRKKRCKIQTVVTLNMLIRVKIQPRNLSYLTHQKEKMCKQIKYHLFNLFIDKSKTT